MGNRMPGMRRASRSPAGVGSKDRMVGRNHIASLLLVALAATSAPVAQEGATKPQDVGLIEHTGRRLVQLDVTVTGPADELAAITADDFELVVGGHRIESFTLDRICDEPAGQQPEPDATATESSETDTEQTGIPEAPAPVAPAGGRATYPVLLRPEPPHRDGPPERARDVPRA